MTIEFLYNEMVAAMKSRDKLRKETISGLIGAIKKVAIDKNCRDNISESLVNEVLLKEQKTIHEMIDTCPADRTETLQEYNKKMSIIKEFTPQLISDYNEILSLVNDIITTDNIDISIKNKGTCMKTVMPKLKGKVDMKVANKVVGDLFV